MNIQPQPLVGKVAIITGANQGLGREIARAFVSAGAHVMICARNAQLLEIVRTDLTSFALPSQKILAQVADVAVEADAQRVVAETLQQFGCCHVLVNNAGIYGPKGYIEEIDWIEWTKTIEINLYGSIFMCRAVLPTFKRNKYGKIIQLSGGGATNPMPRISAYAVSKAAVVRFAETLAEEVQEFGININAIAPGALNTRMLQEILEAGPGKVGQNFYDRAVQQRDNGGGSFFRATSLAVFLASHASDGITGKLISALWDDWESWPEHLPELRQTDAYTLRRIVGRDRGLNWGDKS